MRGGISKMGSRLVRWAALEAVARYKGGPRLRADFHRIAERRGTNKARVAVARKLLTLVYYGLRDGEIRCLRDNEAVAGERSDTTTSELDERHDSQRWRVGVCD